MSGSEWDMGSRGGALSKVPRSPGSVATAATGSDTNVLRRHTLSGTIASKGTIDAMHVVGNKWIIEQAKKTPSKRTGIYHSGHHLHRHATISLRSNATPIANTCSRIESSIPRLITRATPETTAKPNSVVSA